MPRPMVLVLISLISCAPLDSRGVSTDSLSRGTDATALAGCPYMTFSRISKAAPDRPDFAKTVGIAVTRNIEDLYTKDLERVGFVEVEPARNPAFFLGTVLHTTELRASVVHGTVFLRTTTNTHRDYTIAMLDGALENKLHYMGVDGVIEVLIEHDAVADSVRGIMENHARQFSSQAWQVSADTITALCEWRAELADAGLAVEELRAQLVREMIGVRKRALQRKSLEITVEENP